MIIRDMMNNDVPGLMDLCQKHFYAADMDKRGQHFEKDTAIVSLRGFLENPNIKTLVIEEKGALVGITSYLISKSIFDSKMINASEIMWYVDGDLPKQKAGKYFIKLYNVIMGWLMDMKVKNIHIGVAGTNCVKNFLVRRGFVLNDYTYRKEMV